MAVPPAWTDVWIAADAASHLQATGRDAKGRKQYRYHADFTASRSENKFADLVAFGAALGRLRRRVDRDLRSASARPRSCRRRGGPPARSHGAPRRQRGVRPREQIVRAHHPARPTCRRSRHDHQPVVPGQVGARVRRQRRQRSAGAPRPALPEPSRPTTVPVPNGGRWAPRDRFDRRQRLPRRTRQRLDVGQVVSHVERHGARRGGIRAGGR